MRCNVCWGEPKHVAYVTRCGHYFCEDDAKKKFTTSLDCPSCEKTLSKKDLRAINLEPSEDFKMMNLRGYPPSIVFEICQYSIQFWESQQKIAIAYEAYLAKRAETKLQQTEQGYNEKLVTLESQNKILLAKCKALEEQCHKVQQEFNEIQDKSVTVQWSQATSRSHP
eukprot:TRINITY_DN12220_c0_g1_i1.p1 TRINITY_DN12220_c0_g1~~TRINITY_DN12220_c0_g1_i1.p1  ORF type:complete len:168 (-),score=31.81 TRINITY_DN12220_c0_g1_i1:61-564(-)